jgi:signal transduction histidine kinase
MKLKDLKDYVNKNILTDRVSAKSKACLSVSVFIMFAFFFVESLVVFKVIQATYAINLFGYICVILFTPPFAMFVKTFLDRVNSNESKLLEEVLEKNTYLEHAAKILRHDMHSGINTYIPRGLRSLERRLDEKIIKEKKLESPLRLLKEGLAHSQQVYRGVFEFTNLVRKDSTLQILPVNIKESLETYLKRTSYKDQVLIEDLPEVCVNESLFCTAVDNLIRNGLKYNDSPSKWVKIKMIDKNTLTITDNGRGMSQEEFDKLRQPYSRKADQKESGSGLGLNICVAILNEHGFSISCEKLEQGTMIRINFNDQFYTFGG